MSKKRLITEEEAQRIIDEDSKAFNKKNKFRINKIVGLTSPIEIERDVDGIIITIE